MNPTPQPPAPTPTPAAEPAPTPTPAPAPAAPPAPTTPTTPAPGQPPPEGDKAGTGATPAGAPPPPEAQTALQVPEGVAAEPLKALAAELKLPPEAAQRVADWTAAQQRAQADAFAKELTKLHAGWKEQIKAHPDFGGAHLDASLQAAKKAVNRFFSEEERKALDESALLDFPALLPGLIRIGKAMGEDTVAGTANGSASAQPNDAARLRALYPNSHGMFVNHS
jgi:hypothetical protein